MSFRTLVHVLSCLAVVTLWLVGGTDSVVEAQTAGNADEQNAQVPADDTREDAVRKQQREENLKLMEQRASGMKVRFENEKGAVGKLVTSPLFHYTDQPRRIVDATLWGWTVDGCLAGICKIEKYQQGARPGIWLYCFGSLSPELINVEWADGHRFSAKKPGIVRRPIAGAPGPAEGKPARLRQLKELAGRFSSTLVDVNSDERQEMRLLPRPLFRYEVATDTLLDGAVFGITANGTNPDAILVIEALIAGDGTSEYMFGASGMTQQGVVLKLDDKPVWSKPPVPAVGQYDTWTYFWENR